jgi:hypothetical protein
MNVDKYDYQMQVSFVMQPSRAVYFYVTGRKQQKTGIFADSPVISNPNHTTSTRVIFFSNLLLE